MILYSTSTLAALFVSSSTINIGIPTLRLNFPIVGRFTQIRLQDSFCASKQRVAFKLRVFLNGQNMWLPRYLSRRASFSRQIRQTRMHGVYMRERALLTGQTLNGWIADFLNEKAEIFLESCRWFPLGSRWWNERSISRIQPSHQVICRPHQQQPIDGQ